MRKMTDALAGFDWDAGNRKKCQKHDVRLDEIEAALTGPRYAWFPIPATRGSRHAISASAQRPQAVTCSSLSPIGRSGSND